MPNKWTFRIPAISALIDRYVPEDGKGWAEPFAGRSTRTEWRNDLNPAHGQPFCKEALDFMAELPELDGGVLFDPPYSVTQVSRSYQEIGLKFKGAENPTGGFPKVRDLIAQKVKSGGYVLSFGWNTVGMGKVRGFRPVELLIVCHGGNHNDTLCKVEQKA